MTDPIPEQLHHLADRARRGVLLPAEGALFADAVTAMAATLTDVTEELAEALEHNEQTCEAVTRRNQAEAAIERVRAALDGADRYDDMDIIRAALNQAQQPAAGQARCPSCEHEPRYHSDPAGCWFTVLDGKPDRDSVCGCRRPAHSLKQQPTTTEA